MRSRHHRDLLALLIQQAVAKNGVPRPAAPATNGTLLKKAGKATIRWAASGFKTPDRQTIDRRLDVCATCVHLEEPPDKIVYKVALTARSTPRVCRACGCFVARKASMAAENCPVEDPARPGFSLWGEPIAETPA